MPKASTACYGDNVTFYIYLEIISTVMRLD
jgi:hypothetical protein